MAIESRHTRIVRAVTPQSVLPAKISMHSSSESAVRMLEIESRQDEALRQLAELELQVERALTESLPLARKLAAHPTASPLSPLEAHAIDAQTSVDFGRPQ